jgi:Tol biopolymer transport system component
MGAVYRATDTKLKRDVAVKVLPDAFAQDPDRLARFQREAQVLAALNHPNIAAIYGVEESAFIMELVEGESLRAVLERGPLPLESSLHYAAQIADALEAAHERGVVHRDLKPANIMITPAGVVKVLDFGLAAVVQGAGADPTAASSPANSPTLTMRATQAGMILGTAGYMSPEQARGKTVDKRADIWAFGIVLYEMITGRQTFGGDTVTDILASVVKEQPDLTSIPPQVRTAIARCLSKDPRERWGSIGDVRWALENPQTTQTVSEPRRGTLWAGSGFWIAATALLALALPAAWFLKPHSDEPLIQTEISAPPGARFGPPGWGQVALSPDGRRLLFLASKDGTTSLWMRLLSSDSAAPLPGTAGAASPFWSPDSRWVGFFAENKLQKIDPDGGRPQVLCEAIGPRSSLLGTWNAEGLILFSSGGKPIQKVSAAGGSPTAVFPLDAAGGEQDQVVPVFLPDGKHFLFMSIGKRPGTVTLGALDGARRPLPLTNSPSPVSYAPNPAGKGWMFYVADGLQLTARPFDAGKGEFTGETAVAADQMPSGPSWSTSATGLLAFRHSGNPQVHLSWFNRDGKPLGVIKDLDNARSPRISPDQRTIAFARLDDRQTETWFFDTVRGAASRFSSGSGSCKNAVWSADGKEIFCTTLKDGTYSLMKRPASGIGRESTAATRTGRSIFPLGASRDGRWLLVREGGFGTDFLAMLSLTDGKVLPMPETAQSTGASLSPDGRWLAYVDTTVRRPEVWVRSLPPEAGGSAEVQGKFPISTAGGSNPIWGGGGKEIFYVSADGKMMAVPMESGPGFLRPGAPKTLFAAQVPYGYDVSSDGQRFLIAQPPEDATEVPITIVSNWPKLLPK